MTTIHRLTTEELELGSRPTSQIVRENNEARYVRLNCVVNQAKKATQVAVGTRVYNHGDMANPSHHGTITRLLPATKFSPEQVEITRDEPLGGFETSYVVYAQMVGDEFKGHSGTRIVTEKAYQAWREERMAQELIL